MSQTENENPLVKIILDLRSEAQSLRNRADELLRASDLLERRKPVSPPVQVPLPLSLLPQAPAPRKSHIRPEWVEEILDILPEPFTREALAKAVETLHTDRRMTPQAAGSHLRRMVKEGKLSIVTPGRRNRSATYKFITQ
jgi:hypothetical protein